MSPFKHLLALALLGLAPTVSLGDERMGAFRIVDHNPNVVILDGEIDISAPLDFRRALQARPDAELVVLNSPGGLVASGLILASDLHEKGLSTVVPAQARCYSACSFLFFAGTSRLAEGELGVHQMSGLSDTSSVQASISDILEALERFQTPSSVITRMFRTPSEDMYVFSTKEIDDLAINRLGPSVFLDVASVEFEFSDGKDTRISKAPGTEDETSMPVTQGMRLALYGGLDFYGADISSARAPDAVECAVLCLAERRCVAFTFNANPSISKGPNCFLKGGIDRLEAYGDALSGVFLGPQAGGAITYSIGAIDPTRDVMSQKGLTGHNLSSTPAARATTPGACRMACVDDSRCQAFTFDAKSRQCHLKASAGSTFNSSRMTSGIKRGATFSPLEIIDLSK